MKLNIKKKRLKKKLSIRELEELSWVSRTTANRKTDAQFLNLLFT